MSVAPGLTHTAHAAPMQMAFYDGTQFPAAYRHDAFVAMHGSWNRKTPSGYEVVRVRFDDGAPIAIEPFLTGFLVEREPGRWACLGRPVGLAVMPDGALLVGDDANGVIYRVSHTDGARDRDRASPPDAGRTSKPTPAATRPLAVRQVAAPNTLSVSSPSFRNEAAIPAEHSDYGEKFSPALRWSGAPATTKSFVVLVEDPDADKPRPFVHWVVYGIPASVTQLDEAMPTLPRLADLGALQGRTSRGNIGYFGPRPPREDTPHHYHFQVFALDTTLTLDPAATAEQVIEVMRGHVVAAGTLVGTFDAPEPP